MPSCIGACHVYVRGAMRCLRTREEVLLNTPIWATRQWGKWTGKDQTKGETGAQEMPGNGRGAKVEKAKLRGGARRGVCVGRKGREGAGTEMGGRRDSGGAESRG